MSPARRRSLLLETIEDRILCSAVPTVAISAPSGPLVGEQIQLTATFDNAHPTDTGFGPYVDVVLPATGTDGAGAQTDDGISFVNGSATYLGTAVTTTVLTFDASGNATHPYAKDTGGNSLVVTGTPGDQLLVFQLPFGSFAPSQPGAAINFSANVSNLADVGTGLNIQARGGFQYGNDALDNPSTDPSLVGSFASTTVTPQLFTLTKTYLGPEDETATGPNFLRQYRITVDVANGQTLTNLDLTDALPNTLQFVSVNATTVNGVNTATTSVSTPSTTTPGGTLTRRFASVTGTAGTSDAEMIFTYFVPRIDSTSGVIVNATSGNDVTIQNNARTSGTWVPIDGRDTGSVVSIDPAGPEHTLTAKSIATQKSVSIVNDIGAVGATPGDTLEYAVQIQVSDYFAFQNLVLTDLISDGQRWDSTFAPTMSWNEQGGTFGSVSLNSANYNVSQNFTGATASAPIFTIDPAVNDGTTSVSFRLSDEMVTRGQDGRLIGGGIPTGGTGAGALPNNPALPFGATTVTVRFRSVIQDSFSDTFASGEAPLNPRDVLDDTVSISGDLLQVTNVTTPTGQSEADDSSASVAIVNTAVSKSIYAINGSTNLAPFTGPGGELLVSPADTVTYRLQFTVPTGDVENLVLSDYLPLPVFSATQVTTFQDVISAAVPAAGFAKFGPAETVRALTGAPPVLAANATNNLLSFSYGTADDSTNTPRAVDLLFTVTVSDDPFADGLFLTNQVQVSENNTQQPAVQVVSDAIVQVQLQQPAVAIYKGVVGYNNTGLTLGGISFSSPAGASSFTGTVSSLAQAAAIAASDLSSAAGVDAGDEVRYGIVVQNTGRNDAFDVSLTDAVVPGYTIPASLAAMNLVARRGDGTLLTQGVDYTASINGAGVLTFTLTDNYTSGNSTGDGDSGALSRGFDANTGTSITNGSNTVVLTYDLTLQTSTPHTRSTLINTTTLTNYAGSEGGADFTTTDISDSATVQLATPTVAKALTATEITTGNNSSTQAVVGELVTYTLTVTVPEGTTPAATLVDTMGAGLAFVDVVSVTNSAGLSTANTIGTGASPSNVTVGGSGSTLTFNFGNITNATSSNGTAETITIVYRAVVVNTLANQSGTALTNSAVFSAQATNQPFGDVTPYALAGVSAANVTVIEPAVTVTKLVGAAAGGPFAATLANQDAGNSVFYSVQIANAAGSPTAFELFLSDTLPATLSGATIASVVTGGFGATPAPVAGDFQISGGTLIINPAGPLGGNIDVPGGATITIVVGVTLTSAVEPGQSIPNTATVRWSSMDGSVGTRSTHTATSTERDSGSLTPATNVNASTDNSILNNYAATSASGTVTILNPTPVKTIDATSESGTTSVVGVQRVAVGEIIRYRVTWQIPEGTSNNLRFTDALPVGLQFLNDGTATMAFVSTAGTINSSIAAIGTGASVTGDETTLSTINPQFVIPSAQITGGAFGDGTDPVFTLGNVVNTDSDANNEFAVLEFNAIVRNQTSAQRFNNVSGADSGAVNLSNTINAATATSSVTSAAVVARVTEPSITNVTKTISAGPYDAGDIVTFTVTFANVNSVDASPAYDVALTDVVPAFFDNVTFGSISAIGTVTGLSGSAVGNTISGSVASMNPGAAITLTYTARFIGNAPSGQQVTNTANLTYSSLPGTGTALDDGVAATTDSTPGTAGTVTGERTGVGGAGADGSVLNNYADSSSVTITAANPTFDKTFRGGTLTADDTSVAGSSGSTVVVGEQVTYDILVNLPEGVTQSLAVIDAVPAGLRIDGFQILTTTVTASQLAANFNGSFASTPLLGAPFTGAGNLTLNFGNATVAADNDTTNNSFVIRLTGTVVNTGTNITGATRTNTATLQFTNPNTAATTTVTDSTPANDPAVTVAEPTLTIGKTVNSGTVDAGDAVSYTITLTNTSAQTAYDVSLSDVLPSFLSGATVASVTKSGAGTIFVNGVATNPVANTDVILSGGTLQFAGGSNIDMGPNTTLQIVVSGTAATTVTPNLTVTNTATTTWTSTDGTNADERSGSGGALNPYTASSSIPFTVPVASITKALFATNDAVTTGANLAIGETATYALTVTLPEGTSPDLIITDLLPAGLQYVSSTIATTVGASGGLLTADYGGTLPAATITGGASSGDDVTFTFGSISTTGDNNTTNNRFVLFVTARALDVVGNVGTTPGQTSLANSASLDITGDGVVPATTPNVTLTVVEPRLQITKAVSDNTPDIGQTLGYTLTLSHTASSTATANDVLVRDTIPAGLTLDPATIRINGVLAAASPLLAANASTPSALDLRLTSLALASTVTITYDATVTNSTATTGQVLDNRAKIYWDSLAGYDGNNSVLTGTPDGSEERDFGATPAYDEAPTPGVNDPAQDAERVVVNTNAITGFVYRDNDSSGALSGPDTAISGVTITLTGTTALGISINTSTTTAPNGSYSFAGLPPGTYLLTQTQPANHIDGVETAGNGGSTFGGTTSPALGSNTISAIVIPAQSNVTQPNYNFGETLPSSLAGSVYLDTDNNGTRDAGETPLSGIPITLTGTDVYGQAVSASGTTDGTGDYFFANLRPGSYTITEDDSAVVSSLYLDGRDTPGSSGGAVGGASPDFDVLTVTLPQATAATGYNFGELRPASLAGSAYLDADGNGVRGGSEAGLPNVTVTLTGTDDRGNAVALSTLTNGTGAFSFTNLRPGTYTLTETQPAAYQDGADALGSLGGSPANDVFSNIAVPPGANGVNYTFGERNAGISGTVYVDRDADGTIDSSDTGRLGGVTVRLLDSGANLLATTTTASDGSYFFSGLTAGNYLVEQVQPTGYGSSTSNTRPVTMPANGLTGVDFGETTGSLGGTVFLDNDASGTRNGGDTGLGGVLVTLTGTDANGAAVNRTATTAADGSYLFSDLLSGTYAVQETQPALYDDGLETVGTSGGTLTPTDGINAIPLAAAVNATGYDFGELTPVSPATGAIRGTVFLDGDKDAVFDLGEGGVSGVSLELRDSLGNTIATTTTNASGAYSFGALAPGNYTVVQTQPLAYGSSTPNTLAPITVAAGSITDGQDFGETYGSLAGFVFVDANDNGAREGGEAPIGGVTVTLTGTDINGAAVNRTTTTGADGSYRFGQLLTGTYTITEIQPATYSDGRDALGTAGGTLGNDLLWNIGLGGGIDATAYNFGELAPTLRGTVFVDADRDGARVGAENGLGGVTLTLRDALGNDLATTTTAADGSYTFTGIAAGTYTVVQTQPVGYGSSTVNARTVTVPASGLSNVDFGETTATLGGRVYVDTDGSGDFDAGDTNLGGVTITLTGTDANGAAVNRTTTTAADGTYLFEVLLAGNYTVTETQPSGYSDGPDNVGSVGGVNSANDTFSSVPVGAGADATGYNFGEAVNTAPGTGAVAGTVYRDTDRDGTLDGGETGLGGVTLTLRNNLGATIGTTTTNPNGSYLFTGIAPGSGYQVVVTQPPGYAPTSPLTLSGLNVTSGNVAANNNFGEATGSLAGRVFRDDNNDGVQNGSEPGLSGVIVTLTGTDVNGAITPIALTTNPDGSYSFTDLLGGTYTVTETQPASYGDGLDTAGTSGGTVGADTVSAIALGAGVNATGYTFGELGARITGTVFGDDDTNGTQQAGELGISGVTLQLRDTLGNLVATTTTLPDGTYSFDGLTSGSYTVVQIQPPAYGSTTPNSVAVAVPTGGTGVADFGESTGSISGVVYHDRNHDGVIDPGEPLLAGVTVTLTGTDVGGLAVNRVTTTLADGTYTFNGLPAGTYTLIESQPVGYVDGRETLGSVGGNPQVNDRFSGIGLGAGADVTGYLFGERVPTDLVTTKTNGVGTVRAGQLITYTITVENVSLQEVEGLLVTDQFPVQALEFVSASNGGVFNASTGTITWNLGQLASAGGTVSLTIDARVRTPVPALVERITNRVTATDTQNPGLDPTPANNSAVDRDTIPARPDLYVIKASTLSTAKAGDTIQYTLTGGNAGDQSAAKVVLSDPLPPGLRFVSATFGGRLVGNAVEWDLGTLVPGEVFSVSVTVVVEQTSAGTFVNTATITDASNGFEDPTPQNNSSSVPGEILASQTFAFDGFHDFSRHDSDRAYEWRVSSPEVLRDALLPLQPIYSGEADPGATLLIELFNSRGVPIGSQTVVTDTGGNWLATFPSTVLKDAPNTARITQIAASYSLSDPWGHNLRTYFTPAINSGHFFLETRGGGDLTGEAAPLLGGLGLEQPLQLGAVKYGGEFLTSQATASGR